MVGNFNSGDSYIVLYSYNDSGEGEPHNLLLAGHASTADEKGASALLASKLDGDMGGGLFVRVVQGKEPAHFCAIFKGAMVVHSGGLGVVSTM